MKKTESTYGAAGRLFKHMMSACLSLLLTVQIVSAQNSQSVSLNVRNISIENVLNRLKTQYGLSFVMKTEGLDLSKRVTLEVEQQPITDVLARIFSPQDIEVDVNDSVITIGLKNSREENPYNTVTGIVTNQSGIPVIGAAVIIQGTSKGVVTDENGGYQITVPAGSVLEYTCIGYKTVSESVEKRTIINIILEDNIEFLEEAVAIGYGSTTRKNLTTSVSSVKAEGIEKAAISNISGLLLGRAAGVQAIVNNSQPDGRINISIRGAGTPVYVVDGIVMPSSALENSAFATNKLPSSIDRSGLGGINPEDIESIEILKDASAAIYGIGASDGVILITTKNGKSGKPSVSYSGSGSFVTNQRTLTPLNAEQYMRAYNVTSKEQYLYNNNMYPYGTTPYDNGWEPLFSEQQIASNTIDTDWTDMVLQNGYIVNQNVTIQGGSDKIKYYLGLNYYDQAGTVKNSGMKRYVVRTKVDVDIFPFLQLQSTLNYNNNTYQNSTVGGETDNSQAAGAYYASILYPPTLAQKDDSGNWTQFSTIPNPEALLDINDQTKKDAVYANFNLKLDIIKNMITLNGIYGINKDNVSRNYYIPSYVYFNLLSRSRGQVSNAKQTYQTFEATLKFTHKFGNWLRVDAVAGVGRYLTDYFYNYSYFEDANDLIQTDNISLATGTTNVGSSRSGSEKRSQFIRASFDILDRYIINGTIRRDGTDKFFPSKKYATFPSVSAAWKISSENWMKNIKWINLLKLRASYGTTGRDNLGSSLYGVYVTYGYNISFNDGSDLYTPFILSGLDYDDVTWEKTVMKNIALDFSILNDRIWGSFDLYRNDETNQLAYANSSWLDMFSSYPINSGHYKRSGWELSLNGMPFAGKNLTWTTTLNLSQNKTIWVDRVDNYDYQVYQLDDNGNPRANEPVYVNYYYEIDGIINSDLSNMPESQKSLAESWQKPGVAIIKDQNSDGIIDKNDIVRNNYGDPKLYLGFGNTFTYKNFDLDIYLYGRFGYSRYNYALYSGDPSILLNNQRNLTTAFYDYYNSETNNNSKLTGYAYNMAGSLPENVGTNALYEDASFVRIRNITLGYNFNLQKITRGYIKSMRIYFDVQNPFLFTKFSYVDPEITIGNSHAYTGYPQTRTWSGGIKIQF